MICEESIRLHETTEAKISENKLRPHVYQALDWLKKGTELGSTGVHFGLSTSRELMQTPCRKIQGKASQVYLYSIIPYMDNSNCFT